MTGYFKDYVSTLVEQYVPVSTLVCRTRQAFDPPSILTGSYNILVAAMDGQDSLRQTERVLATFRGERGINVVPVCTQVGINAYTNQIKAEDSAKAKAHRLLSEKHGDLIIWGQSEGDDSIELHFTTDKASSDLSRGAYNIDHARVSAKFQKDFSVQLQTFVYAQATHMGGDSGAFVAPLVATLRPKLETLLSAPPAALTTNQLSDLYYALGAMLSEQAYEKGDFDGMHHVADLFRKSLELRDKDADTFGTGGIHYELALTYGEMAELKPNLALLQLARGEYQAAVRSWLVGGVDIFYLAFTTVQLAEVEFSIAQETKDIELYKKILTSLDAFIHNPLYKSLQPLQWMARIPAGKSARELFQLEHKPEDLDRSISYLREAIALLSAQENPKFWIPAANSLALSLRDRGVRDSNTGDLDESIDLFEKVAALYQSVGNELGSYRTRENLVTAMVHRFKLTFDQNFMKKTVDLILKQGKSAGLAGRISDFIEDNQILADVLTVACERTRSTVFCSGAIDYLERLFKIVDDDPSVPVGKRKHILNENTNPAEVGETYAYMGFAFETWAKIDKSKKLYENAFIELMNSAGALEHLSDHAEQAAIVKYHLGDICVALDKHDFAIFAYEEAADLAKKSGDAALENLARTRLAAISTH